MFLNNYHKCRNHFIEMMNLLSFECLMFVFVQA